MKIKLLQIGKTNERYLQQGIEEYEKRIKAFVPFVQEVLPHLKNASSLNANEVKEREGQMIIAKLKPDDYLILLDERGKEMNSREFAGFMQKNMNAGMKQVVFLVGGAFGFSDEVYLRANQKLSLSKMTYSHQLIRLIFTEQLYRSFTIINNHPYHND
jgi:23S rRNA (pseudouridine1915-N3)-methyltransferase